MKLSEFLDAPDVGVDAAAIQAKIDSYTETDMEELRIQYSEYRNAYGPDATKTFKQFVSGVAAMNCLFAAIKDAQ